MAKYIDGFVLVVPKKNTEAYMQMAKTAGKVWKKCGALEYVECQIEDGKPASMSGMKVRLFADIAKAKPDENVWFSYIVFKSRKHRDQVNAKVMKDPFMNDPKTKDLPMPFDMKRLSYAGFNVMVDL